jgi:hypothetical protein
VDPGWADRISSGTSRLLHECSHMPIGIADRVFAADVQGACCRVDAYRHHWYLTGWPAPWAAGHCSAAHGKEARELDTKGDAADQQPTKRERRGGGAPNDARDDSFAAEVLCASERRRQ